jgi:hypothetical protein
MLNNITFYNEIQYNIKLSSFLNERTLSDVFVPIATFNLDHARQENELVAMIEGSHFPFFGLAFSVEKFQFNHDLSIEDDIDHNKYAIKLAQRFANLFVDEARLSGNVFRLAHDEYQALIENYDAKVIDNEQARQAGALVTGELYLF